VLRNISTTWTNDETAEGKHHVRRAELAEMVYPGVVECDVGP
jgi:hypothetical protein